VTKDVRKSARIRQSKTPRRWKDTIKTVIQVDQNSVEWWELATPMLRLHVILPESGQVTSVTSDENPRGSLLVCYIKLSHY
jgi:hypothetical protein